MTLALDACDLAPEEVVSRLAAGHKGIRPGWLWPETSQSDWRRALHVLADAAQQVLAGRRPFLEGRAAALSLAGYTSGLGPLVGWWIEHGKAEAETEAADLFALHLRHNRLRMDRLREAAAAFARRLSAADVIPTVFKGMDTAFVYFPEPACRAVSDIDLAVDPSCWEAAEACMAEIGCEPGPLLALPTRRVWTPPGAPRQVKTLAFVHADDPWSIDLHSSLDRAFTPHVTARLQDLVEATPSRSWLPDDVARTLGQPLLTLMLATHASQSMKSLTLQRLVELVLVIRQDIGNGSMTWACLEDAARSIDALGLSYPALHFAEKLSPGLVPARVLSNCARAAPPAVRRCMASFEPATIQRVDRWPIGEAFMWCDGWRDRLRHAANYMTPASSAAGVRGLAAFYAWRLRCILAPARQA